MDGCSKVSPGGGGDASLLIRIYIEECAATKEQCELNNAFKEEEVDDDDEDDRIAFAIIHDSIEKMFAL